MPWKSGRDAVLLRRLLTQREINGIMERIAEAFDPILNQLSFTS